jgi:polyisoprenoid-binding protein YceI
MSTWIIDPAHSEVGFKVKHLMINSVKGQFKKIEGTVISDKDDFKDAKISFTAEAASVDTGSEQRDVHLKSAEFFDVEKFPQITFVSDSFDGNTLKGQLTMLGVTKPVTLQVEFGGTAKDPWGNTKAGFTLSGKINRKDWGLNWNAALETGGFLVSEEVSIISEIQLVKQA